MTDDELASWLRRKVGADLKHWRDLEAAYLPGVPKEGEWLWAGAREHADHAEARLAVLDEHDTRHWQAGDRVYDCQWEAWPCRTVRLLGSAYRRQAGYREAWKP
jgi:hypothetical protein